MTNAYAQYNEYSTIGQLEAVKKIHKKNVQLMIDTLELAQQFPENDEDYDTQHASAILYEQGRELPSHLEGIIWGVYAGDIQEVLEYLNARLS